MGITRLIAIASTMVALACATQARAEAVKTDTKTRDLLIEKLARVYAQLPSADASRSAIALRLADLYSERARSLAQAEIGAGCMVKCEAGREDRVQALSYYKDALAKTPEAARGKILAQVGHLYELTAQEPEAIAAYETVIKTSQVKDELAEARLSLGEIYFKRRRYSEARDQFAAVIALNAKSQSRGLASYRLAWCEFNENHLDAAVDGLTVILRSPELLARAGDDGAPSIDRQFQEEVSRDFATFVARRGSGARDADRLWELSPETVRISNIVYLANETERLGQRDVAVAVWRYALGRQSQPLARLESLVRIAELERSQAPGQETNRDLEAALDLWPQAQGVCGEDQCHALKVRLRAVITDWNRAEKEKPSAELLVAYQRYLKSFADDDEMLVWAAQIARAREQYPLAVELNLRAARLVTGSGPAAHDTGARVEKTLLSAIEAAEFAKDPALVKSAYAQYLELSQTREREIEVRYQLARQAYESENYAAAAEELRSVAILSGMKTDRPEIRKQAADLSLDALVFLKDDAKLEKWSAEYATYFPMARGEFASIARKAVLTQSAQVSEANGGSAQAWSILSRYDVNSASETERAAYFKNRLVLAEKLSKFPEALDAASRLLAISGLTSADREFALSRQAWLSEMILDFDSALSAAEKLTSIEHEQKWLKLAMYAELAGKDARPYYTEYMKSSKDEEKTAQVAQALVREAKDPGREVEKYRAVLAKREDLLGQAYLEAYLRMPSKELAKRALASAQVSASSAGRVIARSLFLDDAAALGAKIASQRLDGSSQKVLARTLRARIGLLTEIEALVGRAVKAGDWTSEVVGLSLLAGESERFYQEVLSLPVPQGLSDQEQEQYLSLLSQQAGPHRTRADQAKKRVSELWADESAIAALEQAATQEKGDRRKMVLKEIAALEIAAPEAVKTRLSAVSSKSDSTEASLASLSADIKKAREAVRLSPMDRASVERLLDLERKRGDQAMSAYLENRVSTLPKAAGDQEGVKR